MSTRVPMATPVHKEPSKPSALTAADDDVHPDPFDDWGGRDVALSSVPFLVLTAFRNGALNGALAFGIAWSGILLLVRLIFFDAWKRKIWPILDIETLFTMCILRGLTRHFFDELHRWIPVILPLIFAFTGLISLAWRRPFSAHFGKYPKNDPGGHKLFDTDANFRRAADLTTLTWISAWSAALLLALVPVLTGHWFGFNVLNIIFDYIVPFSLFIAALIVQVLIGEWYKTTTFKPTTTAKPTAAPHDGVGQPAGPEEPV